MKNDVSPLEEARQEHIRKHGSMLYCVERDTICAFMQDAWITGCQRSLCILDDPENIALMKRIELKRAENARLEKRKDEKAAPIRNQTGRIRSYKQIKLEEIHRLEEQSQQAYHNNNPRQGETLFNRAQIMRGELKRWEKEQKER